MSAYLRKLGSRIFTVGKTDGVNTKPFRRYQDNVNTLGSSVVSSPTQMLQSVTITKATTFKVRLQATGFTTTTANNSITMRIIVRRSANGGNFASSADLSMQAVCTIGGNPTAYRPANTLVTEWFGTLNVNDVLYAAITSFDNPTSPGSLGGGSYGDVAFYVEEV